MRSLRLIFFVSTAVLFGCTGNKALLAEKEFLIEDQRARLESCESKLLETQEALAESQRLRDEESQKAEADLAQCRADMAAADEAEKALIAREQELREKLSADIEQKNIEIERLKDRLSLRVVDRVLFKSGSVEILPEGQGVLSRIAENVIGSEEKLRVEGHTDNVRIGPSLVSRIPTNWELSVLRATSVVRFLEGQKIASQRMTATGNSKYQPVAENDTAANRQLNRRVEIVLIP